MFRILIFLLLSCSVTHAQENLIEQLSDEELKDRLYIYLLEMESKGVSFKDIQKAYITEKKHYVQSRESYYRFAVYMKYFFDKKSDSNVGEKSEIYFKLRDKLETSYADYVALKKTDEAKERWENSNQDGVLKLVVANVNKLTESEQERYVNLLELLNRDKYFYSFVIADMTQTITVKTKED